MECFAFGGVTVRFASLETSFHAASHTIPPPPSNEGLPHCPKDKNHSPFHGEKPCIYQRYTRTVPLDCIRLNDSDFGEWRGSKTAELFAPSVFCNRKNATGYWF